MTTRIFPLLAVMVLVVGCGRGPERPGGTMQDPVLGVSLQTPMGWRVHSTEQDMASKGEGTGIILEEPMLGRSFDEVVDELTGEFGAEVVSRAARTIDGHEAVEAVIAYPNAGSRALKVYIYKPPNVVEVSFVTPADEFAAEEAALRASVESIRIR